MNLTTGASADRILSLDNIRGQLIRLEDTIIFCEEQEDEEMR
jgi:chorismate mutase